MLDLPDLKLKPVFKAPGLRGPICWSPVWAGQSLLRLLHPKDDEKEKMGASTASAFYAVKPDGSDVRFLTTGLSPDWR